MVLFGAGFSGSCCRFFFLVLITCHSLISFSFWLSKVSVGEQNSGTTRRDLQREDETLVYVSKHKYLAFGNAL